MPPTRRCLNAPGKPSVGLHCRVLAAHRHPRMRAHGPDRGSGGRGRRDRQAVPEQLTFAGGWGVASIRLFLHMLECSLSAAPFLHQWVGNGQEGARRKRQKSQWNIHFQSVCFIHNVIAQGGLRSLQRTTACACASRPTGWISAMLLKPVTPPRLKERGIIRRCRAPPRRGGSRPQCPTQPAPPTQP